jgi:hypothetical protein
MAGKSSSAGKLIATGQDIRATGRQPEVRKMETKLAAGLDTALALSTIIQT